MALFILVTNIASTLSRFLEVRLGLLDSIGDYFS